MPLLRALLTAAHSRLSALIATDGAPSALLNGAPSARHPHPESLLKDAWIAGVEYAIGLQQGIQGYAASRSNRRLEKLERLDLRPKACHAIQGKGGRADKEEEEQGMDGAQEERNNIVHYIVIGMHGDETPSQPPPIICHKYPRTRHAQTQH